MKKAVLLCVLICPFYFSAAADLPPGFTKEIMDKVLVGKVVTEEVKNPGNVLHKYQYAYFKLRYFQLFIDLATDHEFYSLMFEEVSEARTLWTSKDKNRHRYELMLELYGEELVMKMSQKVTYPKSVIDAIIVSSKLTNNKDKIKQGKQVMRLYPYRRGFLVKDELSIVAASEGLDGWFLTWQLNRFFSQYITTFRAELVAE